MLPPFVSRRGLPRWNVTWQQLSEVGAALTAPKTTCAPRKAGFKLMMSSLKLTPAALNCAGLTGRCSTGALVMDDPRHGLESLLLLGSIFIKHFGDITGRAEAERADCGHGDPGKAVKKKGGTRPRVSVPQTVFALCAAVLHRPQLVGVAHRKADIWQEAFDTLIQAERGHCEACLNALVSLGLAAHESRKEKGSRAGDSAEARVNREYYTIKPALLERIFAFSDEVGRHIGASLPDGHEEQLQFSRDIFDFFHYKYLPEWRLFLVLADRACNGVPDERRKVIDSWLHGHPYTWILMHKYMLWLGGDYTSERPFHETFLKDVAGSLSPGGYNYALAEDCIRCLGDKGLGLFTVSDDKLQPNQKMKEAVEGYVNTVTWEYAEFARVMRTMRGLMARA